MPVTDRLTDGFRSHARYWKINRMIVNSGTTLRIGTIGPYERRCALFVGQLSYHFVAFFFSYAYSGLNQLIYANIQCLAGKETIEECIKLYTKDNRIYLDVNISDKNCSFSALSDFDEMEQTWDLVDDTFTPLNPTIS